MLQSIEAVVDHNGALRLLEPVSLPRFRRVIITILEDESEDLTKQARTWRGTDQFARLCRGPNIA